jgi:hypothetical protein
MQSILRLFLILSLIPCLGLALVRPRVRDCPKALSARSLPGEMVYGLHYEVPSASSIAGRYLRRTGSAYGVRQFQEQPGSFTLGPPRLVIAVSPKTYPLYQELFGSSQILEQHSYPNNHAHNVLRWRDEEFLGGRPGLFPNYGTLGIPILLSEAEAYRLHRLFYLFTRYPESEVRVGNYTGYQYPFQIKGYGYPPIDYYNNCAAWPGLLMIGDPTSNEIVLPGNLDVDRNARPRRGRLRCYPVPSNIAPRDHELFKAAFSVPAHQALWEMLGFSLADGDWTAAGWFSHTLLGRAGLDRVPIVVYYTDDHRAPIPNTIYPGISLIGRPSIGAFHP